MEKAVDFTSRFDFAIHVAHARSRGPASAHATGTASLAIDALLQGCVFTMTRWPTASSAPSPRWPLSADWRRSLLPEHFPSPVHLCPDVPARAGIDYLSDGI